MNEDMDLEEILEQVDILEYISQFVELEEKGGEWWGLSPFKDENTPSFSVRQETGQFHDFSSGIGGNIITFIMHYHHCSFHKAVEILKEYADIDEASIHPKQILEATKIARKFSVKQTKIKESTAEILPDNYMDRFENNDEKLSSWISEGISLQTMKEFGVKYDSFSNRIVFPIKNYEGKIINVCGRTLDPDYKEKGLRKYTYFKPLGALDTLYGFSDNAKEIRNKREIIIFEGAKSVMLAHEWGIKNTCAILTSHLNPRQRRFLIALGFKTVFALDEEVDIRKDENISKLRHYTNVEWIKNRDKLLGEKMAPVDAGYEVFKNLYERRVFM